MFCLIGVVKSSGGCCENIIETEQVAADETEEEMENGNLIDEVNRGNKEIKKEGGKCNECGNANADNENNADEANDEEAMVEEEDAVDSMKMVNSDNEAAQEDGNNKKIDDSQTAEGSYNVKDEKSCIMKKNSEKLSKIIRKTRSTNEKGQKVKKNVKEQPQKQKGEKIARQGKFTRNAKSFKQISKKSTGGKYKDQQKTGKNAKGSSKKTQKQEKGGKGSNKKSQKNKKKASKSEL